MSFGHRMVGPPHVACRRASPACVAALAALVSVAVADGPGDGLLELRGGHGLPGRLAPLPDEGGPRTTLLWESPVFAAPLELHLDELDGLRFTRPPAAGEPPPFRVHLRGGDAVDGDLVALDAGSVVVRPPAGWSPTPLRIDRSAVDGISRAGGPAAGVFSGPGDLEAWSVSPPDSWRAEAGCMLATQPGLATRTVPTAARAWYEIAISWRTRPDLRISVAAADKASDDPFRVELLSLPDGSEEAAVVRQEAARAALEPLDCGPSGQTALRLAIFIDQPAGRIVAFRVGDDGATGPVADVTLPAPSRDFSGRLRLALDGGDVRVESIRGGPWTAAEPVMEDRGSTRVTTRDGRTLDAADVSLDAAAAAIVVSSAGGSERMPLADVAAIALAGDGAERRGAFAVRVAGRSGVMLAGDLLAADEQSLALRVAGIDEPVRIPLAEIASLKPLAARAEPRELPGRIGTLVSGEASLPGCIVDGVDVEAGIAFHPRGAVRPVPFAVGPATAATLEYVPRPARDAGDLVEVGGIGGMVNQNADGVYVVTMLSEDGAAATDGRLQAGDRLLAVKPRPEGGFVATRGLDATTVMNLLRGRVDTPVVIRVSTPGGPPRDIDLVRGPIHLRGREVLQQALDTHLRLAAAVQRDAAERHSARAILVTGDVVPCEIISIEGGRVRLTTPVVDGGRDAIEVPGDLLRAVELEPAAPPRDLPRAIAERLLTLPRSQRAEPPTHLVRLLDGDYLRGRLESLDGETLAIDVRGEAKKLPRASVARIIWLQPADGDGSGAAAGPGGDGQGGLIVQGVTGAGRVTLAPESVVDGSIRGTSPALGPGRIDLAAADRLLIGGAIAAESADLPFRQWKLRPAAEPRALREEAGGPAGAP